MSTPPNIKNLWKNIAWKNRDEKRAFFNKYFKGKELVIEEIKKSNQSLIHDILRFIKPREIVEGKNKRPLTIDDIEKYLIKH